MKRITEPFQKIRDLKDEHRRELLALRKIDVAKVDSLQMKYDKLMAVPLKNIGTELAKGAEERKAKQLKILSEIQKFPKKDRTIAAEIAPIAALKVKPPVEYVVPLCWEYVDTKFNAKHCDHSISASTGTVLDTNKATVNCDVALNSCYPFLELHGGGAYVSRELKVHGWLSFVFRPAETGTYSIGPLTMVNGYYLFQTWGGCEGVVSNATLKIKAIITVYQLGMVVHQGEVTIYEHTSSDGQFNPIDYVQLITQSVRFDFANVDATINVGIEIEAILTGLGQVIVDIQKNPNFYFRVPYIDIYQLKRCWKAYVKELMRAT